MSKLDQMIVDYRAAVNNNDTKRIKEIEDFFEKIGVEPLGLKIIAFT